MLFEAIRGQEAAVAILRRALERRRVPSAYLFTGPPGCGRVPAALALAASLNCERAAVACGQCGSCRRHLARSHPDLHLVGLEGRRREIVVSQVREDVLEKACLKPMEGRSATFVIDDAQAMNLSAANAFLRTLEEPPASTHFVLVAPSRDAVLPTIASRCQVLPFRPLGRPVLVSLLEERGIDGERARLLAAMARGSMETALACHREQVPERLASEFGPLAALGEAKVPDLFDLSQRWAKGRGEALDVMETMAQWFRDALVLAEGGSEDLLIHRPSAASLRHQAGRLGGRGAALALEAVEDAREHLEANANVQLTLDNLLLRIRALGAGREA